MKILCKSAEIEKDMQDLVNLFYDEEDNSFSLEHEVVENGEEYVSKIFVGLEDQKKQYAKVFKVDNNANALLKKSLIKLLSLIIAQTRME